MITEDETFKCDFCGESNTGEYYLVTGNHVLCQDYEQKIATLRAQLAEAETANKRLVWRLNWIRDNQNDKVAIRFSLKATDAEIDDLMGKELVTPA